MARGTATPPPSSARSRPGAAEPVPRRERAARDLRALSSWSIRSPRAADHLRALATTHQIDPDSAMVFACLLHLADRDDEQVEFLWQFATGAGKASAAECLALLHPTRGHLRFARHWACQAADLDALAFTPRPRPACRRELRPLTSLMMLKAWRTLRSREAGTTATWTIETFHACAGTLSRTLTTTVRSLKSERDDLTWPDLALALHLQAAATA